MRHDDLQDRPPRPAHAALCLLALTALLATSLHRVQRAHHRQLHARSQPVPHKLQTWEGEGGRPDPVGDEGG